MKNKVIFKYIIPGHYEDNFMNKYEYYYDYDNIYEYSDVAEEIAEYYFSRDPCCNDLETEVHIQDLHNENKIHKFIVEGEHTVIFRAKEIGE